MSENIQIPIQGFVKNGFEKVKTTFEENFNIRKEIGASCCVYYKGEKVVDLWGGFKDKQKTLPWEEDTLSLVFSTTKGIASLAVAVLHSKGLLDYNEKVSTYWNEFAFNGKENITVRQLLSHQAGLYSNDKRLTYEVLTDEKLLSNCLAKQKTYWKVGDKQGYHAWTIGMYINEIVKRVDDKQRTIQQLVEDEIAKPLQAEFYIGLPNFIFDERVAELIPFMPLEAISGSDDRDFGKLIAAILNPFSAFYKSLLNPPFAINLNNFNKKKYNSLPLAAAHGFSNARNIAKIYNDFALRGKQLKLNEFAYNALEAKPIYPKTSKADYVLGVDIPFSLGLAKPSLYQDFGVNYRAYGTFGAGGSGGFADPEMQLAFAYVMNKMGTHIANDPRELSLRQATYECAIALEKTKINEKEYTS
ncbi:MAG: serine hydrolase domain-containing protein [Chitinophagales bacterium]